MKTILKRLREPSTMAGLGVLAVLFGADPAKVQAVVTLAADTSTYVATVAAAAAVFLTEKAK